MIEHISWGIVIASIIATVANIHKKSWCFIIWSITNLFWVGYDIYKVAYGQAALMFVYFMLAIYGLWAWGKKKEG